MDGTERSPIRSVAVVGLGLIGGSLARRLLPAYDVVGVDADGATRRDAAAAGLPVAASIAEAVDGRDLVVVATPLPALDAVLGAVADAARPGAAVTDVTSVKVPALAAARAAGLGEGVRWVGGHPMAGVERSGFESSDPALFDGASWVLCVEEDTDLAAWLALAEVLTGLGCRVVPATAAAHDAAVAGVSALPHLLACALAEVGVAGGPLALALAAGSFRDGSRVAAAPPGLVTTLCDGNRDAVVTALDAAIARLAGARDALRGGGSVRPLAVAGGDARRRWDGARAGERRSTVDIDIGLRVRLAALAASGGSVTSVGRTTVDCLWPVVTSGDDSTCVDPGRGRA